MLTASIICWVSSPCAIGGKWNSTLRTPLHFNNIWNTEGHYIIAYFLRWECLNLFLGSVCRTINVRTILVVVSQCLRSNERSLQKVFLSPRKESHSLASLFLKEQILILLLLNCLQICLTTWKLQHSYILCKMLISEFVPAGRIQLTSSSKGESKHFEVCSSESLFMFVLLKFEMQKLKC